MKKIEYRTPTELKVLVQQQNKQNTAFFRQLKKSKSNEIDRQFHLLHHEAFEQFSCLECANCCASISPIITQSDLERLARHLNIKPSEFLQRYLYMDEDGDFVFQQTPCPFLGPDNYCSVYESRPRACREYPHTDRKKMIQILDLTRKNCEYCPVVYDIVETLKHQNKA